MLKYNIVMSTSKNHFFGPVWHISWSVWLVIFQVKCHVEMSYFEVYNEKIHDLLVVRDEPNQRRMPVSSACCAFLTCHTCWCGAYGFEDYLKKNIFKDLSLQSVKSAITFYVKTCYFSSGEREILISLSFFCYKDRSYHPPIVPNLRDMLFLVPIAHLLSV